MKDVFADVDAVAADLGVSVVQVDELEAPAAAVDQRGIKLILINRSFLAKIPDEIQRTVAEKGLRLHEGWEHRYHNIPLRNQILEERKEQHLNCSVWASIENIVGDAHIEAKGAKDYPNLSKYRSFVLSRMTRMRVQDEELESGGSELDKALNGIIEKIRKQKGVEVNPALIKTMNAFIEAAKFGGVQKRYLDENVLADLRFIIPRVFLTRRGIDCQVVFQAADEIYHYLDKKYRIPPELSIQIVVSTPSPGPEKPGGRDFENILPWRSMEEVDKDVENAIAEVKNQLEEAERRGGDESAVGGLLGGPDHAKLTPPTTRDIQFYVDTVQKRGETIRRLQSLFKRLAGKRWFVPAREGDLNTKPSVLQQAYADSFKLGEDERNYYLVMRHAIPDIDLVIASDQSGCCHPSTQIQLASGEIKSLQDLCSEQRGDTCAVLAYDFKQNQFVIQPIARTFIYPAPKRLYEIHTRITRGVFTGNHRFFVFDPVSLSIVEKQVTELKVGDRALVPTSLKLSGARQLLPALNESDVCQFGPGMPRSKRHVPRIAPFLTPGLAQIFGYFVGDGSLHERRLMLTDKDPEMLSIYKKLLARTLGMPSTIEKYERLRLAVNSTSLVSYLRHNFPELTKKSRERIIPSIICKSKRPTLAGFLRGIFDAEGSVGHHNISFATTSEALAHQTQLALMRFGIVATLSSHLQPERKIRGDSIKPSLCFTLNISNPHGIARFNQLIGFSHPKKAEKLREMLHQLGKRSQRSNNLFGFPLSNAAREALKLVEVTRRERRLYRLGSIIQRETNRQPSMNRYLDFLNAKIKQIHSIRPSKENFAQLMQACHLLKISFKELSKIAGEGERAIVYRNYALRHGIRKGQRFHERTERVAAKCRRHILERKFAVLKKLEQQKCSLGQLRRLKRTGLSPAKIVAIRPINTNTQYVYDMEIETDHNYFANGAITHNSMYSSAELVSEASICVLEAAKRVGKIRTAVVSFGDGIRVLKDFHESVAAGRFYPEAAGGTPMAEALQQALKFRWRWGSRVRRVMVIATDGFPDDFNKVDRPLEEMRKRKIVPIALCIGIEPNDEYRNRFDQVYEVKQTDDELFSAFLDSFIRNALFTHQ